jgi:hypothetical protein
MDEFALQFQQLGILYKGEKAAYGDMGQTGPAITETGF